MTDDPTLYEKLIDLLPGPDWLSKPETIAWLLDESPAHVAEVLSVSAENTGRTRKALEAEFDALVGAHKRLCDWWD